MTLHDPRRSRRLRPRVEGDREQEILDAALEVLGEVGYDRLTMDAVAQRAKASKATLYRRWNSKATLVVDGLARQKPLPPVPDTGDLRSDLITAFCGMGGLTDHDTTGHLRGGDDRVVHATPSSPRSSAPACCCPSSSCPARCSSALATAARSAPTSTSTSSPRPWPGSSCTVSS